MAAKKKPMKPNPFGQKVAKKFGSPVQNLPKGKSGY